MTSIGEGAFAGCYMLQDNFVNNSNCGDGGVDIIDIEQEDGLLVRNNKVIRCRSWATSVTIPNYITSIGDFAFYKCAGLATITISNSVKDIGNSAFYKCKGLTTIIIPNSVKNIGHNAFQDCSDLTSIAIPNSVTSIGGSAFQN